jgi:3-oxoacyl-[acyl-carrier protein] reductase
LKQIVILGGTGNVGQEILAALHQQGLTATFTYHRSQQKAEALTAKYQHRAVRVDLSDVQETRQFFRAQEKIDVLLHCAGVSQAAKLSEITLEQFEEMQAINVRSAFIACQEVAPKMSDGGHIVLLSAIDGTQTVPAPAHFAASQGALVGLTRALAKELGPKKTLINLVALGVLEGGISRELSPKLLEDYKHFSAMRRVGSPQEAAKAILWVALQNTYMTGQIIPVNGGL